MFLFQDWVSHGAATSAAKMSTWLTDSFLSCLRCNHPRPPSLWSCCPWTKWQIKLNLCLPALSGNNIKLIGKGEEKKKNPIQRLCLTPRDFPSIEKHDGRAERDENGRMNVTLQNNSFCEIWGPNTLRCEWDKWVNSAPFVPTHNAAAPLRTFTYSSHLSPAA